MPKPALPPDLVPGLLATAALGGGFFAMHLPVMIAAGVAVAVYGGTRLLLSVAPRAAAAAGDDTAEVVARGRRQVTQLRQLGGRLEPEVRGKIGGICNSAEQIFAIFEADPAKTPLARGLVDFTLGKTLKIVSAYCDLWARDVGAARPMLDRVQTLLGEIETSFRGQIDRLLREDVAGLESEIEVLQTRLEVEGDTTL
jgi:5-bromo-4-chloroindolyl phosphate hydrolysis protein